MRIQVRNQVSKSLKKGRRHRPELNISFQPVENTVVGQVQIGDNLTMVRRVFCDPALQFDQKSGVLEKNRFDFGWRSRNMTQVLQRQIRNICRAVIPLLSAKEWYDF